MNMKQAALLDAIQNASKGPPQGAAQEGGPDDQNEQMCCPKCHFCGPEREFQYSDKGLDESDHAAMRVGTEDQDA